MTTAQKYMGLDSLEKKSSIILSLLLSLSLELPKIVWNGKFKHPLTTQSSAAHGKRIVTVYSKFPHFFLFSVSTAFLLWILYYFIAKTV